MKDGLPLPRRYGYDWQTSRDASRFNLTFAKIRRGP